jgi:hypothetical protein
MRESGLGLVGLAVCLSLAGCASNASSDGPRFVGERADLTTLNCHELDAGLYNAYALVIINEEAEIIARKKIRDDTSMTADKKILEEKALDFILEDKKQKVIDPSVASYRSVEKEYKARCKDPQTNLSKLKKDHPSKYIR